MAQAKVILDHKVLHGIFDINDVVNFELQINEKESFTKVIFHSKNGSQYSEDLIRGFIGYKSLSEIFQIIKT